MASRANIPRACNVEDIFHNFEARREGLLRALTYDAVQLHLLCHPYQDTLRLYGLPNRTWELKVPEIDRSELRDIPAPTVGINFARPTSMHDRMWKLLVAIHSDSWLLAVAFYYAARSGFDLADREQLYSMINDVPTLYEIVEEEEPEISDASSGVADQ